MYSVHGSGIIPESINKEIDKHIQKLKSIKVIVPDNKYTVEEHTHFVYESKLYQAKLNRSIEPELLIKQTLIFDKDKNRSKDNKIARALQYIKEHNIIYYIERYQVLLEFYENTFTDNESLSTAPPLYADLSAFKH